MKLFHDWWNLMPNSWTISIPWRPKGAKKEIEKRPNRGREESPGRAVFHEYRWYQGLLGIKKVHWLSIKTSVPMWMGARGIRRFGQLTQSLGKRLKTRADGPKNGPLKAKGLQSSVYKDSILKPHILYPANGFRTGSFNIRLSGRLYSSFGVMN